MGSEKALFHLFQAEQGVKMLHKGFSPGGPKCCTRGFLGPKKGFSWLPNAQVQKVSPAAPKKPPAAQPFDFEGKRRAKKGKFYDAKNATRGFPGSMPEQGVFLSSLLSAKTLHKGSSRNPNRSPELSEPSLNSMLADPNIPYCTSMQQDS